MTTRCPEGHESSASDYCDVCGAPMAVREQPHRDDTTSVTVVDRCPLCGHGRTPGDVFCEQCGFDLSSEAPTTTCWVATIAADRDYHERLELTGFTFPEGAPARRVVLDRDELLIGRSTADGDHTPDIDLADEPEDPAASRRHARLVRRPDDRYAVVDDGSANGTFLNDDSRPIEPGIAHPLDHGNRIHLGAWTTITVSRAPLDT